MRVGLRAKGKGERWKAVREGGAGSSKRPEMAFSGRREGREIGSDTPFDKIGRGVEIEKND
jgi:hypothetical protein